ncbi:DUF6365 family protein [Pyxidicoccus sp. MSG2]|uniref:DUF6365 family protein n=1 Tax=Pyxidicoccus sp. MSG2 TaxID=2996790 RepID=UPI00226D8895|nr:DUF6365 family protein [Pyxidicoccus sp. MSG2]MCY1014427.1 DUF6365 family protein [Pyxidicoccus sp. MSG2]
MKADRFLFLALTRAGWGETALGLRIAEELTAQGSSVSFLAHKSNSLLMADTPFAREFISDEAGMLVRAYVDSLVKDERPTAIVLSDMATTQRFCSQANVDASFLAQYGLPLLAIDTWDQATTGATMDLFLGEPQALDLGLARASRPLLPVPILHSAPRPGAYDCMPEPVRLTRRVRTHLRDNLGIGDSERLVLLCTATWQHMRYRSRHGNRMAAALPLLLAEYVSRLGPSVHLVHVGPAAFPLQERLGERYHWLPPLQSLHFEELLGSSDLLVSANISAGTNLKAIASGVPTVVVHNSHEVEELFELESRLPQPPSDALRRWLVDTLPLYRFRLWPLGWFDFLAPVLKDNPFMRAVETVELTDERAFVETCQQLLHDDTSRRSMLERQAAYVAGVRRLPRASEVVRQYLAEGTIAA